MAKKGKKNKGFQPSPKKSFVTPSAPSPSPLPESNTTHILCQKTRFGVIDTQLYERLLKPAIRSFALREDDEPLRQLAESIVTSIAMHDAYEGYQKIDDIFQRYLYYLETIESTPHRNRESVELCALRDYWRTQVLLTLVCDANAIFGLLLSDAKTEIPAPLTCNQAEFLASVDAVLNAFFVPHTPITRNTSRAREIYDFVHGVSFPWLGYPSERAFALQTHIPNDALWVEHPFALASAEFVQLFHRDLKTALHDCLCLDLIYAQHKKLYDELASAFDPDDLLPHAVLDQLSLRVRFDKTYQTAYDTLCSGQELSKSLHRASRLNHQSLSAVAPFIHIMQCAAKRNMGVFIFHFMG